MLDYMEDYLKTSGLSMQFVMLTDIIEEKTELLYVGRGAKNLVYTAFRKECGEHSVAAGCCQPQKADGNAAAQRNGGGRDHVRRKCLVLRAGAVRAIRNEYPRPAQSVQNGGIYALRKGKNSAERPYQNKKFHKCRYLELNI